MVEYGKSELDHITGRDPVMKALAERFGHLEKGMTEDVFVALVESIVGQMLSNKAAGTLCGRLKNIVGEFTPAALAAHSAEEIKSCGISRRKAECILALAQDTLEGKYDFSSLETLSDEKVIEFLTQIKGVGRWTAEMIAEFSLGRKNVFSETDVALRNGIMQAHGYKTLSKRRFAALKKKYSPYCSVASLYYYELNDVLRGSASEKQ